MIMNDYYSTGQETQTWLEFALECNYINESEYLELYEKYDHIIAMVVNMIQNPEKWCLRK